MKKQLLKKMAKAASVALVAGAMVCGASLTNVNAKSVKSSNSDAKAEKQMTRHGLIGSTRKSVNANKKSVNKNKKNVRKNVKRAKKATSKKSNKKATKNSVKKNNRKARKNTNKVVRRHTSKRSNARHNAVRHAKLANREARQSLRRRAVKPMNRRAYRAHLRAVKNFRQSRYYHDVWSNAEKTNKRAVRLDQKRLNKTINANNSKHLTKYEHRALNRSIKAQQHHINYMNRYVSHDAYMLSLAK